MNIEQLLQEKEKLDAALKAVNTLIDLDADIKNCEDECVLAYKDKSNGSSVGLNELAISHYQDSKVKYTEAKNKVTDSYKLIIKTLKP